MIVIIVSVFDHVGNFIHCFGSKGSANGQFSTPVGIALSPNGSIYVSEGFRSLPTTDLITIMCLYFTGSEVTM